MLSLSEVEVLVVGAGPAGLALAIGLALRGRHVHVVDPHEAPWDKACGEGLMAPGVAALSRLGIVPAALLARPLAGVRYLDGKRELTLGFGDETALGLRRTRLAAALRARAGALGVIIESATLEGLGPASAQGREVTLRPKRGPSSAASSPHGDDRIILRARWVVGADGLKSRVRRLAGLDAACAQVPKRFALRQHLNIAPWSRHIEVHLGRGFEAYVTPVDYDCINVAFLSERPLTSLAEGLSLTPALADKLGAVQPLSRVRGAGPLAQAVRAASAPGVALVGDAAGYVDANTGEGLSLALLAAESLATHLAFKPAPTLSLGGYDAYLRRLKRRYRLATRGLLWLGRHRRLRSFLLFLLGFGGGNGLLRLATALPADDAAVRPSLATKGFNA